MTEHRIGTQEAWQAERDELLVQEKELVRRSDELARKRRNFPGACRERLQLRHPGGTKSLAELFDGRSQLLVYHFMFGPTYETGCPVCSSIHRHPRRERPPSGGRDVTMMLVSRARSTSSSLQQRMGWDIPWASAGAATSTATRVHQHRGGAAPVPRVGPDPGDGVQNAECVAPTSAGYVAEGPA